jgi:hypothetical protein
VTRAEIAARKAAIAAAKAGHDAFNAQWPALLDGLRPLPELKALFDTLNNLTAAHATALPLITAEIQRWDAAVPSD